MKYVKIFNFTKGLQCSYTYINYNFQYELCIQPLYVHHNHLTACMLNLIYAKPKDQTFINWLHVGLDLHSVWILLIRASGIGPAAPVLAGPFFSQGKSKIPLLQKGK